MKLQLRYTVIEMALVYGQIFPFFENDLPITQNHIVTVVHSCGCEPRL